MKRIDILGFCSFPLFVGRHFSLFLLKISYTFWMIRYESTEFRGLVYANILVFYWIQIPFSPDLHEPFSFASLIHAVWELLANGIIWNSETHSQELISISPKHLFSLIDEWSDMLTLQNIAFDVLIRSTTAFVFILFYSKLIANFCDTPINSVCDVKSKKSINSSWRCLHSFEELVTA